MIGIIDYGAGNLMSVKNAVDALGIKTFIISSPQDFQKAEKIIFPGVGSFGAMMQNLEEKRLITPIKEAIKQGKPFLGICLGMQALFEESEESLGVKGLEIFKGKVVKFTKGKVPQIGWNKIKPRKKLFEEGYAYFVNSYYIVPEKKEIIAATTDYEGDFVCAIQEKNVTAVQFHPEKSSEYGMNFIKRWITCSQKE